MSRDPRNYPMPPQYNAGQSPYSQPQAPAIPGAPPMPAYNLPDPNLVRQAYETHRAETVRGSGSGTGPQYVKFPGPQGQLKWDASVPIKHQSKITIFIAPPWQAGKNIFVVSNSHFYKSQARPQGSGISCPGAECLICRAREAALASSDPVLQAKAKDFGRVRKQYLYNVLLLENSHGHYDAAGTMRPFVLAASSTLHAAIGDIIEEHGVLQIVDPSRGRPIRIAKRKTGPNTIDIEYSAIHLDPCPLPYEFYGALANLWDLEALNRVPTYDEQLAAVNEMGLILPTANIPSVPYPNPYATNPYAPPQAPIPVPPPVQSQGQYQGYRPQPSQAQPVMPMPMPIPMPMPSPAMPMPPMPGQMPVIPTSNTGVILMYPLQPGITLPGGRERCFGNRNDADNYCRECPAWISEQCAVVKNGSNSLGDMEPSLEELQAQLRR